MSVFLRFLIVTVAGLILAACGGGGDNNPPSTITPEISAEGVWRFKSATEDNSFDMVILETGETWVVPHDFTVSTVSRGQTQSSEGVLEGTVRGGFNDLQGALFPSVYYSGTYSGRNNINIKSDNEYFLRGLHAGEYWNGYDQPASLASLAGKYDGVENIFAPAFRSITITISPIGIISLPSGEDGCKRSGKMTPHASGKNMFDLTIVKEDACNSYDYSSGSGIAYYDDSTRRFVVLTSLAGSRRGFVFLGTKSF